MSLLEEWNKLAREGIGDLGEIKELKKRDIRRLFIFIGKFIRNLKESAVLVKRELEEKITTLRDNVIIIKKELDLKILELENRIKVLEGE